MKTILFDGAFGTYYNSLTNSPESCEWANVADPDKVLQIHKEYLAAGATAIKTNTFAANSLLCDDWAKLAELVTRGYALAERAAKPYGAAVFADIGGVRLPCGEAAEEYTRLACLFLELGAENFLFETLAEWEPVLQAARLIKSRNEKAFVIASFAVSQDGYTSLGKYYKELIASAQTSGAIDAAGLNCVCGPSHILGLIRALDLKGLPFSVMPNGGYPTLRGGQTYFESNPGYFADKLLDIHKLGVSILGGCCGTDPTHIRLTAQKLEKGAKGALPPLPDEKTAPAGGGKSSLFQSFDRPGKVVAVELTPPADCDISFLLSAARKAAAAGADLITVTDSPLARTRADSFMVSAKIKREVGIEVLPHLSCRDKNHIGIKATLLGGHIENIRNLLAVTGDPVAQADRDRYRGVFSFNSFDLISFIANLNKEVFAGAPYTIAGALNVNAPAFEAELGRAERKIACGAGLLLTQPIFTQEGIENLKRAHSRLPVPLFAGIMPVGSFKNACFLNNEVTGVHIPERVVESLRDKTPEEVLQISADFAMTFITAAFPYCRGFYLMTPLKRIDIICELIGRIRGLQG